VGTPDRNVRVDAGRSLPPSRRLVAGREQSLVRNWTLGPEHPDVATILENLAGLLEKTNRPAAQGADDRAKAIRARYGRTNPLIGRD
jgi:hypothetical protein